MLAGGQRCRRVFDVPRDRLAFLSEQLRVKPVTSAQIARTADLYQPPEPKQ
jgi:hypothetical protein